MRRPHNTVFMQAMIARAVKEALEAVLGVLMAVRFCSTCEINVPNA